MSDFFRFPHTPHLLWLGEGQPRDDKILSPGDVEALLSSDVVVEEKLDGANLGFSIDAEKRLRIQNRGQYLIPPYRGQFSRLGSWLPMHETKLVDLLSDGLILFGEWCVARHSLDYDRLPDWFIGFDVYDRREGRFWSADRRDQLIRDAKLASTVPRILSGITNLEELRAMLISDTSRFRQGAMEGMVIRKEAAGWLETRAKLVHPNFTQAIGEHWSKRTIEWNTINPFATQN